MFKSYFLFLDISFFDMFTRKNLSLSSFGRYDAHPTNV